MGAAPTLGNHAEQRYSNGRWYHRAGSSASCISPQREAVKEKAYRDARAKLEDEVMLGFGGTEMSKEELRKVIDSDKRMYYRTENLNDKLYIHYKGWKELKNLEGWTGLRVLYAECNAFGKIQGLQHCRQLRSLFLQENCIRSMQ